MYFPATQIPSLPPSAQNHSMMRVPHRNTLHERHLFYAMRISMHSIVPREARKRLSTSCRDSLWTQRRSEHAPGPVGILAAPASRARKATRTQSRRIVAGTGVRATVHRERGVLGKWKMPSRDAIAVKVFALMNKCQAAGPRDRGPLYIHWPGKRFRSRTPNTSLHFAKCVGNRCTTRIAVAR